MKKIDWEKFWDRFEIWYQNKNDSIPKCKCCGKKDYSTEIDWEDQQKKIQKMVEALIRKD